MLTELKRNNGISKWSVIDSKKKIFPSFDDVPVASRQRIQASMFPPTPSEIQDFNLHFCARFYPHLQDTGGFFIAVIEKIGETNFVLTSNSELQQDQSEVDDFVDEEILGKTPKGERTFSEEPFHALSPLLSDQIASSLEEYYGIPRNCSEATDNFLVRAPTAPTDETSIGELNMVYKVSSHVYELLKRINGQNYRFVAAGVRFVENFSKRNKHLKLSCDWRITAEALPLVAHLITKRIIQVGLSDFKTLLKGGQPQFHLFSPQLCTHLTELSKNGPGVVTVHYSPTTEDLQFSDEVEPYYRILLSTPQYIMGWLGFSSLTTAINKLELKSWRNYFLTTDYSFEFDASINTMDPDEKAALIESNKQKKRERDAIAKREKQAVKMERRKQRSNKKTLDEADKEEITSGISQ